MAELGSAFVNIIPKAPGIESELKKMLGDAGAGAGGPAGQKAGSSLLSTLKKTVSVAAVGKILKDAFSAGGNYEQLAGGVEKIFDGMDTSKIFADAADAYKTLNLSANDYLSIINDVGAGFAASMGAQAGYETAQKGLQAIADYASGTGKSVDTLSQKFTMIARSTSSYMSIADQFSGILPATSADFLAQAQAAGFLSSSYTELTQVPIAEYQAAVSSMLAQGVDNLNLTGNTAKETATTLTGSLNAMKASWTNVMAAMTTGEGLDTALSGLSTSTAAFVTNFLSMGTTLAESIPELMSGVGSALNAAAPELLVGGTEMALQIASGLVSGAVNLVTAIPDIVTQAGEAFLNHEWGGIGGQIIGGIAGGLLSGAGQFLEAIKSVVGDGIAWAKSLLGIQSPSKVFANEVGRWIPEGMAVGVEANLSPVNKAIGRMTDTATAEFQRAKAPGMTVSRDQSGSMDKLIKAIINRPVVANVAIQGDTRKIFKVVQSENGVRTKATGYNALARA